jgi:CRP/FNR family transcriptional regulator
MPRDEVARVLRSSPVFAGLPTQEVETMTAAAREETYRPRDAIFREGDPAAALCLVRSGRVKIVKHSRAGKDVVLEMLGPGEIFGGVAVIEQRPYPAGAEAVEASVVVKIPADTLRAVSDRHPSVIRELALMLGRRLRTAHDSMRALAVDPVEARLAGALLRLAEREGAPARRGLALPFHLTRQSLADMAGTTVETAIRTVSRWLKDGLVADEGGRLVIEDVDALRSRAGGEEA